MYQEQQHINFVYTLCRDICWTLTSGRKKNRSSFALCNQIGLLKITNLIFQSSFKFNAHKMNL